MSEWMTLADAARMLGIPKATLLYRLSVRQRGTDWVPLPKGPHGAYLIREDDALDLRHTEAEWDEMRRQRLQGISVPSES